MAWTEWAQVAGEGLQFAEISYGKNQLWLRRI